MHGQVLGQPEKQRLLERRLAHVENCRTARATRRTFPDAPDALLEILAWQPCSGHRSPSDHRIDVYVMAPGPSFDRLFVICATEGKPSWSPSGNSRESLWGWPLP